MSSSSGTWTPCSILLTRVKRCLVAAASARPDRPASLRISRIRVPSASRACLAALDEVIVTVRYRQLPNRIERPPAQPRHSPVTAGSAVFTIPVDNPLPV
jgi:hypothetical protein